MVDKWVMGNDGHMVRVTDGQPTGLVQKPSPIDTAKSPMNDFNAAASGARVAPAVPVTPSQKFAAAESALKAYISPAARSERVREGNAPNPNRSVDSVNSRTYDPLVDLRQERKLLDNMGAAYKNLGTPTEKQTQDMKQMISTYNTDKNDTIETMTRRQAQNQRDAAAAGNPQPASGNTAPSVSVANIQSMPAGMAANVALADYESRWQPNTPSPTQ